MNRPKKLPKHAKRVFESPEFDVWEWPQKMFDGTTKTFRRVVQSPGVSILAETGGKIVVLYQQQPNTPWYYGLPGGLPDPGETPIKAAARELIEETGYKPGSLKLWKHIEYKGRLYHERHFFVAQNCVKVGEPELDGGEKIRLMLMTFEQLLKLTDDPKFFRGDMYIELLHARADLKYKKSLKQAIFGYKSSGKKPKKR